jgi:hypothetical protein
MTGRRKGWTRVHATIALDRHVRALAKDRIDAVELLKRPSFRAFTIRALQAEAYEGDTFWPHSAVIEDAIDEWLMENGKA